MAKKRDFHYIVPMSLERTVTRLNQITELGIRLEVSQINPDTITYVARRVKPRRNGKLRVVDEDTGQMHRLDDEHTRVEPVVRALAYWKIIPVYIVFIALGLVIVTGVSLATESLVAGFWRRALAFTIIYAIAFLVLQPQRLFLGRVRDERFSEFIHDVLKGPYADPENLYEQYFNEARYWETQDS